MFKVTPPVYSSPYIHVTPLSRACHNGFALTVDRTSAVEKLGSKFLLKNSRKRSPDYLAFGLSEPKPKRVAADPANTCSTRNESEVQTQVKEIYASRQQSIREPEAGTDKYATVTIRILEDYQTIAKGRQRYDEIAIADFMTSNNLDPKTSIYFSRHALTPEGRKLLIWLEQADDANGLSEEEGDAFFAATAQFTHDTSTALLVGARNLEYALAWYCLPAAKQIAIVEFCAVNALSYSSLQKHFFGGGILRERTQERLARRFGDDTEEIICMAKKALRNDVGYIYVSAAGEVMPEWKALLLGCQIDCAMKGNYLVPIPSTRQIPAMPPHY